ncbi:MAG: DUF1259 domain-containing protein [Gemmatimonadales bacterium]
MRMHTRWSVALLFVAAPAAAQAQLAPAWDSVATILKTAPAPSPGYVRYNLPRRDLTIRIGDVTVATALAAGAWCGMSGDPSNATAMGDLVLTTDEVRPVLAQLAQQHISVTAIHNHLVGEEPRLVYVHFHAEGAATDIARRLDAVIALTGTPRPVASPPPPPLAIDTAVVFGALGRGRAIGNVAQISLVLVPDTVRMHGRVVVPAMGYGSPINIQAISPQRAVATGDFSVRAGNVEGVTRALAERGIMATAVHSHLVGEEPKVSYIHFWADGPLATVVAGLRSAVEAARQ